MAKWHSAYKKALASKLEVLGLVPEAHMWKERASKLSSAFMCTLLGAGGAGAEGEQGEAASGHNCPLPLPPGAWSFEGHQVYSGLHS